MEPAKPSEESARLEGIRTCLQEFLATEEGRAAMREILTRLLSDSADPLPRHAQK